MITRLTAAFVTIAVLATASLAIAASARSDADASPTARTQPPVVQLERVVVTAKRLPGQ